MNTERINKDLADAMAKSPWSKICYEELLGSYPEGIREVEARLSAEEGELKIPEGISVENIMVPGCNGSPAVRLRVYKPKDAKELPVMLYFHGGAFIFGTPERLDFIFYRLALEIQYVIVSVDYRLAPESPFPAAVNDGYAALLWIENNAEKINADKEKIIVGGSSTGGTLAIAMTHMARNLQGPAVQFQFLLYPATDDRLNTHSMDALANAPMQTKASAEYMWNIYLGASQTVSTYASPMRATSFAALPPAYMAVCELDPLRDEGIAYAQRLMHANVPVELHVIPGAVHAFDFIPCLLTKRFYQTQVRVLQGIF